MNGIAKVRVVLPQHLRTLAHIQGEVQLELARPVTRDAVLTELERRYPMLLGTMRDRYTHVRRPFLRFFACEEDLSDTPDDEPLPEAVANGTEPYLIIGAVAGG